MTLKFFRFVRGPSRVPLQSRWEAAVLDLAVSLPRSYFVGLPWSSFARRPISISPSSLWTCSIDSSDRCRRASHAGQPQGREGNLAGPFLHGGSHGRRLATTSSWPTPSHAQNSRQQELPCPIEPVANLVDPE
jgi:hypothetical protein